MHKQVPAPVAAPPATDEGTKIVAIGNPGAGKSFFLNCLMGKVRFESEISYGGGLTKSASEVLQNGTIYIDTPGIADQMIEKVAARSVTDTLRKGGVFKLLFFVRLEAGRVIADDLVTIQRVLGSIRGDVMNHFAIVV
ncbi:hypothetical protein Poli38472_004806 [Pythium oligandrum]|uniref:G domain-containing protein n=1 Tax=Pythium oligandrum TaxID=41045 RepID=A0A8K1CAS5_PYTOL|nr:hypothetical protein Poli38472_004806 [Pythium oligandrum]|eukprot:TMW59737.1 hypothetical protein Poli38472_004806 [Pythium oligandrum]